MRVKSLDRVDADDPFMLGLMREHGRAGDIADRINPRHIGAPHSIRNDNSAFDFHVERFKPQVFDLPDANGRIMRPASKARNAACCLRSAQHYPFLSLSLAEVKISMPCFQRLRACAAISTSSAGEFAAIFDDGHFVPMLR
jgi:hypothetical protein